MSNKYKYVGPFGLAERVVRSWIVETDSGETQLHRKSYARLYASTLKKMGVPVKVWQQDIVRVKTPGISVKDSGPYRIDITNQILKD